MAQTVFVTGGDRGLGLALCTELLKQDWQVFAAQFVLIDDEGNEWPW